jgi:Ferritin-like domain
VVAPERGLTRRAFLGAAGVSLAALVAGCGGEDKAVADARADAQVLSALLARERGAVARLAVLRKPGERGAAEIARARAHDEAHVRRLSTELGRLGGERPAADNGAMPAGTPLAGALAVKQDLYARYLDALGRLRAARVRVLVVSIAAVEAEHIAALRAAAGADPLDDAFPMGERS